jgi:fructuronate reductase
MKQEVAPTLRTPPGVDLDNYGAEVLARFANRELGHRTLQVAMDGTQKLPQRLLGTIQDRLAARAPITMLCLAVAGWMRFVWLRRSDGGLALEVDDPMAQHLTRLLAGVREPADAIDRLLSIESVFSPELAEESSFREELLIALSTLVARGVRSGIQSRLAATTVPTTSPKPIR